MKYYILEAGEVGMIVNENLELVDVQKIDELRIEGDLFELPSMLKETVKEKIWEKSYDLLREKLIKFYSEKMKSYEEDIEFLIIKNYKEYKELEKFEKNLSRMIEKDKALNLGNEKELRNIINNVREVKKKVKEKIEMLGKENFPNLYETCGFSLFCELLEHAKKVRRIAMATTQQIVSLGNEKQLFKNMSRGKSSLVIGILKKYVKEGKNEKEVLKEVKKLALNIIIAARKDYFGENGNKE